MLAMEVSILKKTAPGLRARKSRWHCYLVRKGIYSKHMFIDCLIYTSHNNIVLLIC